MKEDLRPLVVAESVGVEEAWREFGPHGLAFAAVLVGPSEAHDVLVNAFLRCTRVVGWSEIEHFDRYLLKAVRNEARNLARQRERRRRRDLAAVRVEPLEDAGRDVDLLAAIAALSLKQRSVVFLAYWHDMTEKEIADTLGVSRGTVHRNLQRARTSLKEALT